MILVGEGGTDRVPLHRPSLLVSFVNEDGFEISQEALLGRPGQAV